MVSVMRAATAGRIEVVELAVLQTLVGDAEAQGSRGERHRRPVAVQHEDRLGMDPARDLRPRQPVYWPPPLTSDLIPVEIPSATARVGVDPEHLFGRSSLRRGLLSDWPCASVAVFANSSVNFSPAGACFGMYAGRLSSPACFSVSLSISIFPDGVGNRSSSREISFGAAAKGTRPASRISATVTPVPSSW